MNAEEQHPLNRTWMHASISSSNPPRKVTDLCSGLKDKNGKWIYENDFVMVNDSPYLIWLVKYDFGKFYLDDTLAPIATPAEIHEFNALENMTEIEVVGNLYENETLLGQL